MEQRVVNLWGAPGAGKTSRLIRQVVEWIGRGVPPERIAYLAFTKAAAGEAMDRITATTGAPSDAFPYFKTLHSSGFALLGLTPTAVATPERIAGFARGLRIPFSSRHTDIETLHEGGALEGNLLMSIYDFGRNRDAACPEEAWEKAPLFLREKVERGRYRYFVKHYEEWKAAEGFFDFIDMLGRALERGETFGCSHVIIDEAQDLTPLQWRMARLLESSACEVWRGGDDDQSIFPFCGARTEDYVNLPGERLILPHSYRMPQAVYRAAIGIIEKNRLRVAKSFTAKDEEGQFRRITGGQTAYPETGTVAELFRNRRHQGQKAEALMTAGVPFGGKGTLFSDRSLCLALAAFFQFLAEGECSMEGRAHLLDWIGRKGKGILIHGARATAAQESQTRPFGKTSQLYLTEDGEALLRREPLSLLGGMRHERVEYAERLAGAHGHTVFLKKPALTVSTVHGAKGLEFDWVYVHTDALRECQDGNAADPEAERRVKYVAVSRAKQGCFIVPPQAEGGWSI